MTWALPNAEMMQNAHPFDDGGDGSNDSDSSSSTSSGSRVDNNDVFFVKKYKKMMRNLPLFPCISYSRAVQPSTDRRVKFINHKSKYPSNFFPSMADLVPYKVWWSKTHQPGNFSLKAVEKFLVVCYCKAPVSRL